WDRKGTFLTVPCPRHPPYRSTCSLTHARARPTAGVVEPISDNWSTEQRPRPPSGRRKQEMETLLFDLDGTLYPLDNGYHTHVRQNMWRFMSDKLGIEDPEKVWRPLFQKYNQSAKGLRVGGGYEFDLEDFWTSVRAGAADFIKEAPPGIKSALEKLPQKDKYVFTNCNEVEAEEALALLGIRHHFKGVIGAKAMGETCKPDKAAFEGVLQSVGADPTKTVMFEDSFKNLVTAKSLGMSTVFVQSDTAREEGVGSAELDTVDAVVCDVSIFLPGSPE
ncbi:unnamed protein product, partial [Ectocarpus sp. 12 AP-2014]